MNAKTQSPQIQKITMEATPSDNLISASDMPASCLSSPYVVSEGKIHYFTYSAYFEEPDTCFLLVSPCSWHLKSLTFPLTGFNRQRLTMNLQFEEFKSMPLQQFQNRYAHFYKKMLCEFYNIHESKFEDSFQRLTLLFIEKIATCETEFSNSHKNYFFLPGKRTEEAGNGKKRFRTLVDEDFITNCLNYWKDPNVGCRLGEIDLEKDVIQARYGKNARYTVSKVFPSMKKTSAYELYQYLTGFFEKVPGNQREQSLEMIHKKLYFPIEKLKKMTLHEFIEEIPDQDTSINDFFSVKQIKRYHNFESVDDDSLLHLIPICSARSILTTNPKENSNPNPLNHSFKNQQITSKHKARLIFLCGRFVRKSSIGLDFLHSLIYLPVGLFELEHRLINIDVASRFNLSLSQAGESLYWRALQTKLIDLTDNYETLETLGDSILKFVVSALFFAQHSWSESKMTSLRSKIINNNNLQAKGVAHRLNRLVFNTHQKLSKWYPGLQIPGSGDDTSKPVNNKMSALAVADVLEALVGAVFLAEERSLCSVLDLLCRLDVWPEKESERSVLPTEDFPTLADVFTYRITDSQNNAYFTDFKNIKRDSTYAELFQMTGFEFPRKEMKGRTFKTIEEKISGVEEVIGYKFKNQKLLRCMLERSENSREFERLEFLGDAAVEMRSVDLTFTALSRYYRLFEPHDLHKAKIYLLSNHNMSFFCSFLYLDYFVEENITSVCEEIREYSQISMFGQFLRHELSTIKILGDLWECLMAALIIDGGWAAFDSLYTKVVLPFIFYISKYCKCIEGSAKSAAYEVIAKQKLKLVSQCLKTGQWKVAVTKEGADKPLVEFTAESMDVAEELCYYYISYKLNQ